MSTYEDMLKGLIQCGAIESYEMLDETTAKIKFKQPLKWVGVDWGAKDQPAFVLYDAQGKVVENPFIDPDQIAKRMGGEVSTVHGRPPITPPPGMSKEDFMLLGPGLGRAAQERDWRQEYLAEFKPYDPEVCIPCDGTGMKKSEDPNYPYYMTCHHCKGTGRKRIPDERICMCGSASGHTTNARCSNCGGLIKSR